MPESGQSNSSGGGVASAAISPIASLLTTWMSNEYQQTNVEKTINANKGLAEYGYMKDLEMWNRNNLYNSPVEQMKRLKAAGLNPALIYGSGAAPGNSSGQIPKYNVPEVDYRGQRPKIDPSSVVAAYQDFQMRKAQIDNVKAQTENVNQRTISEGLQQVLNQIGINQKEFDYGWSQILRPYQGEIVKQQARAAEPKTDAVIQGLLNMRTDNVLKLLVADEKRRNITGLELSNELKNADILWKKYRNEWMAAGVTQSDNPALRLFVRAINGLKLGLGDPRPDNPLNPRGVNQRKRK